jgi:FtsP/CotA-like multicopper oxidase with cupredoxin domain
VSPLSRRRFLAASAATGALLPFAAHGPLLAASPRQLRVITRTLQVHGKPATVFGIEQPDGTRGLVLDAGERFLVELENRIAEPTLIHWHGLTPPWQQDGVPHISQPPLEPGGRYAYDFEPRPPGTHWMHSHLGLQEQRLMAAPLIIRRPEELRADVQEVVVMLHDFTFRDPDEILAELRRVGHGNGHGGDHGDHGTLRRMLHGVMPAAMHTAMGHGDDHGAVHGGMEMPDDVHLHDVEFDAFLANDRTLDDPEVHRVERGGRVRLRLINAATATNFWIDTGNVTGTLVAVDGNPIEPLLGHRFPMAIAQRLDILLELPDEEGAWPVLAVREGDVARTGIVLRTPRGSVRRLADAAEHALPAVGLELERRITAARPLAARPVDRRLTLVQGEEANFTWALNGAVFGEHEPLMVRKGERVELTLQDRTTMAHPMHLHGHHFQVVAVNGERIAGPVRDTVLVPARGSVTIAFDADNPGIWALHCHNLYHMAAGMMTTLEYEPWAGRGR